MSITIKELAEKANVSIATISRAINNDKKVKPETKDLILKLAQKYSYRPNVLARNFVKRKTNTIGLILPDVADEFFSDIIRGVDRVAYNGGFNTMIASSHSDRTLTESVFSFMRNGFVDGVILMAPNVSDQIKEVIMSANIPTVLINSKREDINCDTVGIDNFQGSYSMMEYLLKKGYKKIAHVAGPTSNIDAIERKRAYRKAMEDYRLKAKDEWMISGDFTISGGEYACRRLLSLRDKPEVIFASNDMMAIGCYKTIAEFGLKIPDDVAVTGFDDIFVSQFLYPRLTTIHVSISELGKTSANLLIKRINNQNGKEYQHLHISTGLVIGKSCREK
jgi:DNA-binding LacI/PurR family transcriptional regulator